MQTSRQRSTRTQQPTASPLSPAAAKLIQQIQAEARTKLLEELSAKDAITVLHGFDSETRYVIADADRISIRDRLGNSSRVYRRREEPESWRDSPHMAGIWHPAHWNGSQTLVDASGRRWESDFPTMVCDDFGILVEVAE